MPPLRQVISERADDSPQDVVEVDAVLEMDLPDHVIRFTKDNIKEAMRSSEQIGEGATAIVYHGVLDGKDVAIKCMKPDHALQFEVKIPIYLRDN